MDDSRLMAIEIKIDGIIMTILNVYMPYDNGNNIEEYQSYLVKVDSKLSENHYACAIGDFNTNVLSDTHRFGNELINYCDNSLMFNSMIQHGYVPEAFMDTLILPIVKDTKEDLGDSDNYRPIALTSVISKVFELVILERCRSILDTSPHQFGFKAKHGTELSIFALKQVIEYYITNSSNVYLCYVDLSKAFDRIEHDILFRKLRERKIPLLIVRLLENWYKSQKFYIQWGSFISAPFNVTNGVRQGGIMSPVLFNVYIDDLSKTLHSMPFGCYINNTCVNHLVYADDMVLLAPSPRALQGLIDTAAKYFVDNGLMINRKKTKCMAIIPLCNKEIHIPSFYVHGTTISRVRHKDYLGYTISDDLNDNQAIIKEKRGIYARGNMLHRKFKACNNEVKKKLFVSYCTSLYCSALWSTYTPKRVMEEIHIAHNDVYRLLFKLPRGLISVSQHFVTAGIPNFTMIRRRHMYSLYKRILSSSNVIINAITDSFTFISTLYQEWRRELF